MGFAKRGRFTTTRFLAQASAASSNFFSSIGDSSSSNAAETRISLNLFWL